MNLVKSLFACTLSLLTSTPLERKLLSILKIEDKRPLPINDGATVHGRPLRLCCKTICIPVVLATSASHATKKFTIKKPNIL